MDETRILQTLSTTEGLLNDYSGAVKNSTAVVKKSLRAACGPITDEVSIRITAVEVRLTRTISIVYQDAQYRVLSAYYHASPGLFAFIVAIVQFIGKVVGIIKTIDEIAKLLLGESLAQLIDRLIPGFERAWNDTMNSISKFSGALGWGVDGCLHLMNTMNAGADLWGTLGGKSFDAVKMEKFKRVETLAKSYSDVLDAWQKNPGERIAIMAEWASFRAYKDDSKVISDFTKKIETLGKKAETTLTSVGTISNELLSLRNDMPAFVAKAIPAALWDSIEKVDTTVNDRILPALTDIRDRMDELDSLMDAHRKRADELSDKIAHPGDLLSEIDKLPDYARKEQLTKIDSVTSENLRMQNEADYATLEGDLREFGIIAEALTHAPAPLPFMELELPGRSPGIVGEPRETWFVGDY